MMENFEEIDIDLDEDPGSNEGNDINETKNLHQYDSNEDEISIVSMSSADLEKGLYARERTNKFAKALFVMISLTIVIAATTTLKILKKQEETLVSVIPNDDNINPGNEDELTDTDQTSSRPEKDEDSIVDRCKYNDLLDLLDGEVYDGDGFMERSTRALDGFTSQDKALNWISNNQNEIDLCDTYGVVELYVLTVFYFSTNGEIWSDQLNFMENTKVCSWNTRESENGVFCDLDRGVVTSIEIGECQT